MNPSMLTFTQLCRGRTDNCQCVQKSFPAREPAVAPQVTPELSRSVLPKCMHRRREGIAFRSFLRILCRHELDSARRQTGDAMGRLRWVWGARRGSGW